MSPSRLCLALTTLLLLTVPTLCEVTSESSTTSRRLTNESVRTFLPEPLRNPTRATTRRIRTAVQQASACDTTICFALQGDSTLSAETFELAKALTVLTSTLVGLDTEASFSAVQYAMTTTAISPRRTELEEFVYAVGNSTWSGRDGINLAAGLAYCGVQTNGQANARQAIVVVGSGDSTMGLAPAQVVPSILGRANQGSTTIYGISTKGAAETFVNAVGMKNDEENLARVFQLRGFEDISDVLARLVEGVCDVKVCGASIDLEDCEPEFSGELPEVSAEDLEGMEMSPSA